MTSYLPLHPFGRDQASATAAAAAGGISSPWLKASEQWIDEPPSRARPLRRRLLLRSKLCISVAAALLVLSLFVLIPSPTRDATAAPGLDGQRDDDGSPFPQRFRDTLEEQWDRLAQAGELALGRRPEDKVEDLYANIDAMEPKKPGKTADASKQQQHPPSGSSASDAIQSMSLGGLVLASNGYAWSTTDEPPAKAAAKPHPILSLIQRARAQWNEKVNSQSQTLSAAVAEYKRRYHRNPPRGFDRWWSYAVKHKIVLKDEYDQIDRDLRVFRALEPQDLRSRLQQVQDRPESFTIHIDPDGELLGGQTVTYQGPEASLKRATDLGDLIRRFAGELPAEIQMTFTKHDQPACLLTWEHKTKMLDRASEGEYFGISDLVEEPANNLSHWAEACPPDSPLRQAELDGHPQSSGSQHRSFIHDHHSAMDVCLHPENRAFHGYTATAGTSLGELLPLFTFAKTNVHSDILATPLEQYASEYTGRDPVWSEKPFNKLLWRGSTTGTEFVKGVQWKDSQRARMHFLSHETKGQKDVAWADAKGEEHLQKFGIKNLNAAYLDTSFSGAPVQCDAATCKLMKKMIHFEPTMGLEEANKYKYLLDLDGNGWSGRFHRLMSSNALVLKSTMFPEWYSERVMPWVHYVPLKVDYSDLYDIMAFFVGTPDGKHGHDDVAREIASAGQQWARTHWRKEDMAAYMYRLLLEWTRVVNRERGEELDYVGQNDW